MADSDRLNYDTLARLAIYFPILISSAKRCETVYYSSLQKKAKARNASYPKVNDIEVGQTLEWFRFFTKPRSLPDICALIVNKETGKPGKSYDGDFKVEAPNCFKQDSWKAEEFAEFLFCLSQFCGQTRKEIEPQFLD